MRGSMMAALDRAFLLDVSPIRQPQRRLPRSFGALGQSRRAFHDSHRRHRRSVIPKRAMFLHRRELHVLNKCAAGAKVEGYPMRLRALVVAVGLLWPVSALSQQPLTTIGFASGVRLYDTCVAQEILKRQYCLAYVAGMTDAVT